VEKEMQERATARVEAAQSEEVPGLPGRGLSASAASPAGGNAVVGGSEQTRAQEGH
jgi:hypothetical protein